MNALRPRLSGLFAALLAVLGQIALATAPMVATAPAGLAITGHICTVDGGTADGGAPDRDQPVHHDDPGCGHCTLCTSCPAAGMLLPGAPAAPALRLPAVAIPAPFASAIPSGVPARAPFYPRGPPALA